ncbi:hypothetical protein [Clostridium intestinale]|uniref:hypothetical protein n=1 Tax=Clostridium intestinale TaxID=36845 RepID=UPI002DD64C55|nr:hypothetical protein [Clostridium intestinale]WRY50712.1 hypothetical protein P8F83_18900 [Clostridium intestinale]
MSDKFNSKVILNIKIKDPDLISEFNIIAMEMSLSLDEFIINSINKLINDIKFIRQLRK